MEKTVNYIAGNIASCRPHGIINPNMDYDMIFEKTLSEEIPNGILVTHARTRLSSMKKGAVNTFSYFVDASVPIKGGHRLTNYLMVENSEKQGMPSLNVPAWKKFSDWVEGKMPDIVLQVDLQQESHRILLSGDPYAFIEFQGNYEHHVDFMYPFMQGETRFGKDEKFSIPVQEIKDYPTFNYQIHSVGYMFESVRMVTQHIAMLFDVLKIEDREKVVEEYKKIFTKAMTKHIEVAKDNQEFSTEQAKKSLGFETPLSRSLK